MVCQPTSEFKFDYPPEKAILHFSDDEDANTQRPGGRQKHKQQPKSTTNDEDDRYKRQSCLVAHAWTNFLLQRPQTPLRRKASPQDPNIFFECLRLVDEFKARIEANRAATLEKMNAAQRHSLPAVFVAMVSKHERWILAFDTSLANKNYGMPETARLERIRGQILYCKISSGTTSTHNDFVRAGHVA